MRNLVLYDNDKTALEDLFRSKLKAGFEMIQS